MTFIVHWLTYPVLGTQGTYLELSPYNECFTVDPSRVIYIRLPLSFVP